MGWSATRQRASLRELLAFLNEVLCRLDTLATGALDIGGYTLGFVDNDAYPNGAKIVQVMWASVKYSFSSHLDLFGAGADRGV
jgi:hypothetical protein